MKRKQLFNVLVNATTCMSSEEGENEYIKEKEEKIKICS